MPSLIDLFHKVEDGWKERLLTEFSKGCEKSDIDLRHPRSRSLDFRIPKSYYLGSNPVQVSNSEYFQKLCEFIDSEYDHGKGNINPQKESVFKALNMTPFNTTKVVILGQDPYPNPEFAHGLAFSVPSEVKPPGSLMNIFQRIYEDLELDGKKCEDQDWNDQKPTNGCLEPWTKKGVLLLNAALTINVSKHKGSVKHTRLWKPFTTRILRLLNEKNDKRVVFLLWGDDAMDIGNKAGLYDGLDRTAKQDKRRVNNRKNLVLDSAHPGNLAENNRNVEKEDKFSCCRHFSVTNAFFGSKIFTWPIPKD